MWRARVEEKILGIAGERGQAMAEFSVILAFILSVCMVTLGLLGLVVLGGIDSVLADAFP